MEKQIEKQIKKHRKNKSTQVMMSKKNKENE